MRKGWRGGDAVILIAAVYGRTATKYGQRDPL